MDCGVDSSLVRSWVGKHLETIHDTTLGFHHLLVSGCDVDIAAQSMIGGHLFHCHL